MRKKLTEREGKETGEFKKYVLFNNSQVHKSALQQLLKIAATNSAQTILYRRFKFSPQVWDSLSDLYQFLLCGHSFVVWHWNATILKYGPWHAYHLHWGETILLILCALFRSLWRAMKRSQLTTESWGKPKKNNLLFLSQYLVYMLSNRRRTLAKTP